MLCPECGHDDTPDDPCWCTFSTTSTCTSCGATGSHLCTSLPFIKEDPIPTNKDLEDLYNELGSLKWIGKDTSEGRSWDSAIDAVREEIRGRISK